MKSAAPYTVTIVDISRRDTGAMYFRAIFNVSDSSLNNDTQD